MGRKMVCRFGNWLWVAVAAFMIAGIAGCESPAPPAGPVSLNGLALVADKYTQASGTSKELGYLADGEAFAFEAGDVFSFAPVQLQHGKTIKSLI